MNVLILGSGGRENALAWKISQSPLCTKLYIAPGNAGMRTLGENLPISVTDFQAIKTVVIEKKIDFVVVGPEDPLVEGVYDFFKNTPEISNVAVFGPSKEGARLEGSKEYAKEFMMRHHIPTAGYKSFTAENIEHADAFIDSLKAPYVLKADGLAAGKGVLILPTAEDAKREIREMILGQKFGMASTKVVVEEFLSGIELSVFAITDGKNYKLLPTAKDYKRIGEGDTGLNTGGMGAVSPVPFADEAFMKKIEDTIVRPTINGLYADGIVYTGFVFFGLINVEGTPKVIEYNVRMGDPETEAVIPRVESDLLEVLYAATQGNLKETAFKIDQRATVTVVLVSGGYPEAYEKGKVITGLENVDQNSIVFHSGTKISEKGDIETAGGRVLCVTSYDNDFRNALKKSYKNIENIHFEGVYCRKDIGQDLMKY
ncbi:MAG: phosphoribosylamine--glycine ligase [Flavobacteriales bacterium]|nr:phosphoribosylamine--glycine ligase [Flavobacteriales bacterium]